MKLVLSVVLAVALIAPMAAIGFGGRIAFACEVRKDINPATESEAVVLARIDRLARDWHYPRSDTSYLLTLHVERTLRGQPQPSDIEVATDIRPHTMFECAQLDPATLSGQVAVVALNHDGNGVLSTSRAASWVVGSPYSEYWDADLAALLNAPPATVTPAPPATGSGNASSSGTDVQLGLIALGAVFLASAAVTLAARHRQD